MKQIITLKNGFFFGYLNTQKTSLTINKKHVRTKEKRRSVSFQLKGRQWSGNFIK